MPRYFLAYATANESRDFYWDAVNFKRLAAHAPGVPRVDVYIAISEAVPRRASHERAVSDLRSILFVPNGPYRLGGTHFKSNAGRDFSSWHWCLSRIMEAAGPDDYVLCLNRSAYGPLQANWYAAFVHQFHRDRRIGLCGNSINFEGYRQPPGGDHTHVQSYAFLGRPGELAGHFAALPGLEAATRNAAILGGEYALSRSVLRSQRGITSIAWPEHVFFEDRAHDPALPQGNISTTLSGTPFRHWSKGDYRACWPGRLRWLINRSWGRARGVLRDTLVTARARFVIRISTARPQDGTVLPPGDYLVSCVATETAAVAIGSQGDPAKRIYCFLHPGRNSRLLTLYPEAPGHTVSLLAPARADFPDLELAFAPVSRIAAAVFSLLGERGGALAPARFDAGRHQHLLPDAATAVSGEWLDWAASAKALSHMHLEEATPCSAMMTGRHEKIRPAACMPRKAQAGARVGVHLHLHYPELWDEINESLAHLPPGAGLYVTTSRCDEALFDRIRADHPSASIETVENRGRDIAPFLRLLNEGAFQRYECVCKVHGKTSPLNGSETYYGRAWRRRALADLLGTASQVQRIVGMFEDEPGLGLVGPAVLRRPGGYMSEASALGATRERVQALLSHHFGHDAAAQAVIDYFAGSMFWFRPSALERVRAIGISAADFPEEAQQRDATLAHALERLIPTIAAMSGFRISGVTLEGEAPPP